MFFCRIVVNCKLIETMKNRLFLLLAVASLAFVGCEKEITPAPGCFTISKTKQVKFAPGNLEVMYSINPTTKVKEYTFAFANNQWDCASNAKMEPNSIFDLFGWGTGDEPDRSSDSAALYAHFVDWGQNTILESWANPTPTSGGWRTLTFEEWNYILNERPNAGKLRCLAQIDGNPGMLLLPDTWSLGEVRHTCSPNYSDTVFITTDPNNTDWKKFEEAGAVFLPAAGVRDKDRIKGYDLGRYWTSTENLFNGAFFIGFVDRTQYNDGLRQYGFSVRLAKEQ